MVIDIINYFSEFNKQQPPDEGGCLVNKKGAILFKPQYFRTTPTPVFDCLPCSDCMLYSNPAPRGRPTPMERTFNVEVLHGCFDCASYDGKILAGCFIGVNKLVALFLFSSTFFG